MNFKIVDLSAPRSGTTASATEAGKPADSALAGDRERFEDLYKKRDGGEEKKGGGEGIKDGGGEEKNLDLSSLFQNRLTGQTPPEGALGGGTGAISEAPGEVKSDLNIEKLVSRILVSDPAHSPDNEVRLSLNDSFMADTEVRLTRSRDGLLTVSFSTSDANSLQTLVAARGALKEALDKVENGAVRLEINKGGASGDDDSRDRRSRGYAGFDLDGDE